MTNKEYKQTREYAEANIPAYWRGGYYGTMLSADDAKEMRAARKEEYAAGARPLAGANFRASVVPITTPSGTWRGEYLISYYTPVAAYIQDDETGEIKFHRLWDGYSKTTAKHVDAFRAMYGNRGLSKRDWIEMPVSQ